LGKEPQKAVRMIEALDLAVDSRLSLRPRNAEDALFKTEQQDPEKDNRKRSNSLPGAIEIKAKTVAPEGNPPLFSRGL
jgi:hypothetical protein